MHSLAIKTHAKKFVTEFLYCALFKDVQLFCFVPEQIMCI